MSGERSQADYQKKVLWIALAANAVFMVVEVGAGLAFNSVALVADGVHMFSDVAGLAIALVAHELMARPPSARHTYGLQRAEVLGALINGALLIAATGWILFEAVERLRHPEPVAGGGLIVVAAVGLAINVGSAVLVAGARGRSLNMRAVVLHMVSDAAGSAAALLAGAVVVLWALPAADAAASVLIALLILAATWKLLADAVHVLMEGVPPGIQLNDVERALLADEAVVGAHHLHVWSLASDVPTLSAHVVVDRNDLHEAQHDSRRLKDMLRERFGIEHATLELECHSCELTDPAHEIAAGAAPAPPGRAR